MRLYIAALIPSGTMDAVGRLSVRGFFVGRQELRSWSCLQAIRVAQMSPTTGLKVGYTYLDAYFQTRIPSLFQELSHWLRAEGKDLHRLASHITSKDSSGPAA